MSAIANDILLDPDTWDYALVNGDLALSSGSDAAAQAQRQRLTFIRGEWFIDTTAGVPYFKASENDRTAILGVKAPVATALREVFRQALLASPGTATVDSIDLVVNSDRSASVTYASTLDDGTQLVTDRFQIGSVLG
jgi:hypothetical protein